MSIRWMRLYRGLTVVVVCTGFIPQATRAGEDFTADELYCEEVAAQLLDCCGDLPEWVHCVYREPSGCGCHDCEDPGSMPVFFRDVYDCLRDLSCEEIVVRGVCDALFNNRSVSSACKSSQ